MAGLQQILAPQFLTKVISQVAGTSDWLQVLFGCQPGGKNELNFGHGRQGAFHIYDKVRKGGQLRAPGTAAGRRAPNPMGRVDFTYPRMHDSVELIAEVLHNLGQIADPAQRDVAGADMIRRQTETLSDMATNFRRIMLIGMLRDALYVNFAGDQMYFDFSGGGSPVFQQNAQMPAANKSQLNMLGAGNIIDASWATSTTNIPLHLAQIDAAFQRLVGGRLRAVICDAKTFNYVITNDLVAQVHGTSNKPFMELTLDAYEPEIAKTMKKVRKAKLAVYEDIDWYITDEIVEVGPLGSETEAPIIEANKALFVGHGPDDGTIATYLGSEPIAEYNGGPKTVKTGLASWSVERANPTVTELYVLDNALTVCHVPKSRAYGTVIF